jgi:hypothetical protein
MFVEAVKYAVKGSISKANAWAPVGGALVLWAGAYLGGYYIVIPDTLGKGIVIFLCCLSAAWIVIFFGKLIYWPYQKLATLIPHSKSNLLLALDDRPAFEGGLADAEGNELPSGMVFHVRVTNCGEKLLQRCQITFGVKENFSYLVTAPFDLRQGEHRDLGFLRVRSLWPESRAVVHIFGPDDRKIPANSPAWLPKPGVYEIKALSADTKPATLDVELSRTDAGWSLAPCV